MRFKHQQQRRCANSHPKIHDALVHFYIHCRTTLASIRCDDNRVWRAMRAAFALPDFRRSVGRSVGHDSHIGIHLQCVSVSLHTVSILCFVVWAVVSARTRVLCKPKINLSNKALNIIYSHVQRAILWKSIGWLAAALLFSMHADEKWRDYDARARARLVVAIGLMRSRCLDEKLCACSNNAAWYGAAFRQGLLDKSSASSGQVT